PGGAGRAVRAASDGGSQGPATGRRPALARAFWVSACSPSPLLLAWDYFPGRAEGPMPLTLEQYATYLDTRDLPWPAPPVIDRPLARPHLVRLDGVRAVLWTVYGTLVHLVGGELYFEHPKEFIMD